MVVGSHSRRIPWSSRFRKTLAINGRSSAAAVSFSTSEASVTVQEPVEIDALLSASREIGARAGVPTPHLDTLLGLARLHARVHGLYPESATR